MKIIAFDLIGVLASETDFDLTPQEDRFERYFGKDISNDEFQDIFYTIFDKGENLDEVLDYIINNLYAPKNIEVLEYLNNYRNQYKIVIATNHAPNIRKFINKNYSEYVDNVFVSADMNLNKPNKEFYQYILDYYHIKPEDMLFIDDNQANVEGAASIGIKTIRCSNDINLLSEIKAKLQASTKTNKVSV